MEVVIVDIDAVEKTLFHVGIELLARGFAIGIGIEAAVGVFGGALGEQQERDAGEQSACVGEWKFHGGDSYLIGIMAPDAELSRKFRGIDHMAPCQQRA